MKTTDQMGAGRAVWDPPEMPAPKGFQLVTVFLLILALLTVVAGAILVQMEPEIDQVLGTTQTPDVVADVITVQITVPTTLIIEFTE